MSRATYLKSLMKYNIMSAVKLSKLLGVSQKTVSEWQHGYRPIPDEYVGRLSEIFNVDTSTWDTEDTIDSITTRLNNVLIDTTDFPEVKKSLESIIKLCISIKNSM